MANQIIFIIFSFLSLSSAIASYSLGKVRTNKTLCLRFGFSSTFSATNNSRVPS